MGHYLVLLLTQIAMLITPGCLGDAGSFPSLELENLREAVDLEARSGKERITDLVNLMIIFPFIYIDCCDFALIFILCLSTDSNNLYFFGLNYYFNNKDSQSPVPLQIYKV